MTVTSTLREKKQEKESINMKIEVAYEEKVEEVKVRFV